MRPIQLTPERERIVQLLNAGWSVEAIIADGHDEHDVLTLHELRQEALAQHRARDLEDARASIPDERLTPERQAQNDEVARRAWAFWRRNYKLPRHEPQMVTNLLKWTHGRLKVTDMTARIYTDDPRWAHYHSNGPASNAHSMHVWLDPDTGFGPYGSFTPEEIMEDRVDEMTDSEIDPWTWQNSTTLTDHPDAPSDNTIRKRAASESVAWQHYEVRDVTDDDDVPPATKALYRLRPGTTFDEWPISEEDREALCEAWMRYQAEILRAQCHDGTPWVWRSASDMSDLSTAPSLSTTVYLKRATSSGSKWRHYERRDAVESDGLHGSVKHVIRLREHTTFDPWPTLDEIPVDFDPEGPWEIEAPAIVMLEDEPAEEVVVSGIHEDLSATAPAEVSARVPVSVVRDAAATAILEADHDRLVGHLARVGVQPEDNGTIAPGVARMVEHLERVAAMLREADVPVGENDWHLDDAIRLLLYREGRVEEAREMVIETSAETQDKLDTLTLQLEEARAAAEMERTRAEKLEQELARAEGDRVLLNDELEQLRGEVARVTKRQVDRLEEAVEGFAETRQRADDLEEALLVAETQRCRARLERDQLLQAIDRLDKAGGEQRLYRLALNIAMRAREEDTPDPS